MEKSLSAQFAETAESMCSRIDQLINNFEKGLDEDEIAALSMTSFSGQPIIIEKLGYWNPDLIILYGRDGGGQAIKLIQHVSQISLCLVSVKRPKEIPEQKLPKRRIIGFASEEDENRG